MRYTCSNKRKRAAGTGHASARSNHQQRKLQMAISYHTFSNVKRPPLLVHCANCKEPKSTDQFAKTSTGKLFKHCKACRSEMGRKYGSLSHTWTRTKALAPIPPSRKNHNNKIGLVYFILCPDLGKMKIGFTTSTVRKRLTAIQGNSPALLEIVGTMPGTLLDERMLHRKFAKYHSHFEWFNSSAELLNFVKTQCK